MPATLLVAFIVIPIVALVLRATPATFSVALASPLIRSALWLSLATTAMAMSVTIALGTPLAYALARVSFPGRSIVDALIDLPIVLPPAVAGLALLLAFGRRGLFGPLLERAHVELAFTTAAVVMAQVFVASPFYIRAARAGFVGIDRTLEEASSTLGYGALGTFARITVPLALPALMSGATLAWARALGEFGATLMFAGNLSGVSQTMPLAVYLGLESGRLDEAVALALTLVAVSAVFLLALRRLRTA